MLERTRSGVGASVRDLHGQEHVAAAVLLPVPPFDFERSARIAAAGDPRVRRYEGRRLWQALRLSPRLALAMLHADGGVAEPHLYVELRSSERLSTADLGTARESVTRLLRLDLDLAPFLATAVADPVMATLAHRLRGLRPPGTATMFEALVLAMLGQQLWTPAMPGSAVSRLVHAYGERLELVDGAHLAFPAPSRLALAREEELRGCGLTRSRARALRAVARLAAEHAAELEACDTAAACVAEVRRVAGETYWTGELEDALHARRLDSIPSGDLALQRAVGHYYFGDRPVSADHVRGVAARWGAWAGLAAHYLVVGWRERVETARPGGFA